MEDENAGDVVVCFLVKVDPGGRRNRRSEGLAAVSSIEQDMGI